jgi:Transposase, Mutator family
MTTLAPWIEQWRHFTSDLREQFWSDLTQCTRQSWQDFLGRLSLDARDRYLGVREYERSPARDDARNGFYERDVVTRLGPVRVPVARTRRRALCGWSPGGGGAAVDPKSVLTRAEQACREPRGRAAHGGGGQCTDGLAVDAGLGQAVAQFHQSLLTDDGHVNRFNLGWAPAHPSAMYTRRVPSPILWLVLARLIVQGYSCARTTTVVE